MFVKKIVYAVLTAGVFSVTLPANEVKSWDFENIKNGTIPPSWQISATHPKKPLAKWEVIETIGAPSGTKVLSLIKINAFYGGTFNLCYTNAVHFKDGEISVSFKANQGEIDQGGGIMWRVQDSNNYYVARFNPLEDNFRFYIVENGVRKQLSSANIRLGKGWHKMKVVQDGDRFTGYLDGRKLLSHEDNRLRKSGGVGLWTKADAATSFDDFSVKEK
jgi:hypothetical protein